MTVLPGMCIVQLTFLVAYFEGMTGITSGTTGIIVKRCVASLTYRIQWPVSLPHLRVSRVGVEYMFATGGTIPI